MIIVLFIIVVIATIMIKIVEKVAQIDQTNQSFQLFSITQKSQKCWKEILNFKFSYVKCPADLSLYFASSVFGQWLWSCFIWCGEVGWLGGEGHSTLLHFPFSLILSHLIEWHVSVPKQYKHNWEEEDFLDHPDFYLLVSFLLTPATKQVSHGIFQFLTYACETNFKICSCVFLHWPWLHL